MQLLSETREPRTCEIKQMHFPSFFLIWSNFDRKLALLTHTRCQVDTWMLLKSAFVGVLTGLGTLFEDIENNLFALFWRQIQILSPFPQF